MLSKIEAFLNGKKSYIISIITGILSVYAALHTFDATHFPAVPEWVWGLLAAAGLGAIRSAIGSQPQPTKTP